MMQSLMQSVRCCNDSEVKRLLTALSVPKQLQLAFLIRHLQSAVNAGRLPGKYLSFELKFVFQKWLQLSLLKGVVNANLDKNV
jgi:hypothetical protein